MGVDVAVTNLTKQFGKQLIWKGVSLTLPAGEISVMLGPSGTGKSVFLKALIGLIKPDEGSIVIEGTDIASCSEQPLSTVFSERARIRALILLDTSVIFKSPSLCL